MDVRSSICLRAGLGRRIASICILSILAFFLSYSPFLFSSSPFFAANSQVCWSAFFFFFLLPACSLRLAWHGQVTLLCLRCVSLCRSLRPQSSYHCEASARTLVMLDLDG